MKTMTNRLGWFCAVGLLAASMAQGATGGNAAASLLKFTAGEPIGKGDFPQINGVCVDAKDRVIIGGGQIVGVYSGDGKQQQKWTMPLANVDSVAVDDTGFIFVGGTSADKQPQLLKLANDNSGKVLKQWGEGGSGKGQIAAISEMGATATHVLVADPKNRCVHRYTKDGVFVDDLGRKEAKPGSGFATCCGILGFATDAQENVYVGNLGAHRVEIFNNKGMSMGHFGQAGDKAGDFCGCCNPVGVSVAKNGVIFTAEKTIPRVKAFAAKDHKLLAVFGEGEFEKNCARLHIAVDSKMNVYAVDQVGHILRVYHPPQKTN